MGSIQPSLAQRNLAAQQDLARQLEAARVASGRSLEDVAALLNIEQGEVAEALSGARDLTLTELRLLAFAVSALVDYEVEPMQEEHA